MRNERTTDGKQPTKSSREREPMVCEAGTFVLSCFPHEYGIALGGGKTPCGGLPARTRLVIRGVTGPAPPGTPVEIGAIAMAADVGVQVEAVGDTEAGRGGRYVAAG